jgi:hypothetical protein
MPEPIADTDSHVLSFLGHFPEISHGTEGIPLTLATTNQLMDAPPWVFPQVIDNRNNNHSNGEYPHQERMSEETLQATAPQTAKPKAIRPSEKSPNTSPILTWQYATRVTISPQPLGADKPEMRSQPKPGCRNGPLSPECAKHAKGMRETGACWPCRIAKVKVS